MQARQFTLNRGSPSDKPTPITSQLQLHAPPKTDLWRKPPVESFNAPSLTTCLRTEQFVSARVTVSGSWTRLYDQAGLIFLWQAPGKQPSDDDPPEAWVKTGIEFYSDRANLSTVATPANSTSDWSLIPLGSSSVTLEVERETENGVPGSSLWVYLVEGNSRKAVREVTWPFSPERLLLEDLYVGVYVARPTKLSNEGDNDELAAQFTDFALKTTDDAAQ